MPIDTPIISVVIPAYNYGRFLPKAVKSVLEQDFQNLEVIVLDDCSTDDTARRIETFLADARFHYLCNERNLGAVPNINKAFARATGEFVMLLGADDFLLPGSLSRLHQALQRYPEAGFAYGNYVIADDDDNVVATIRHGGHLPCDLPPGRDDFPDLLQFDDYINMGTALFRRAVIAEHGAFDPTLTIDEVPGRFFRATDWDLVLRLSLRGILSVFVYAPLEAFRVHGNQASLGDDFNQQGIAPRETAVLLDRYVVPENRMRLVGHETAILAMIAGKKAHYNRFAQAGINGDPQRVSSSFARAEDFLRRLAAEPCDEPIEKASLSVVLTQLDDVEGLLSSLRTLKDQDTRPGDIIVVNRGRCHLGNLCEQGKDGIPVRYLHLPGASLAEARNIGARFARGPLLYFLEPGTVMGPHHLGTLTAELSKAGCIAVQARIEVHEPAECSGLHGAWSSLLSMVLPAEHPWRTAIPPLSAFAMRRHAFLRLGGFDVSLPVLAELDLILRLERDYPVHQVAAPSGVHALSLIAGLYRQNAQSGNENAIEQALQAIVRRFALT